MVSRSVLALLSGCLISHSTAHYTLTKDYSGKTFFDNFDFYSGPDPTNGHVKYVDDTTANQTSLAGFLVDPNTTESKYVAYLGVDSTNITPEGRPSTRISSKDTFNHSLIIADISHMPAPVCGTWPAYWLLGTGAPWPKAGEIDIIENVNDASRNAYTVHTDAGVSIQNMTMKGTIRSFDCDINSPNQERNVGCSVTESASVPSYGDSFNDNKGGVFVMEYTPLAIRIWFFPRDKIPDDIVQGTPLPPTLDADCIGGHQHNKTSTNSSNPHNHKSRPHAKFFIPPEMPTYPNTTHPLNSTSRSTWGLANAIFTPPLNTTPDSFSSHFRDLQLIFDTGFCGEWAGKVWSQNPVCGALAPTCEDFVGAHPEAFADVFWAIEGVRVYENRDGGEKEETKRNLGMGVEGRKSLLPPVEVLR